MRIKIGTIIEIPTSKGLAYAQYTHEHRTYGSLIRVIEGLHKKTPTNIDALVNTRTKFSTFIPLRTIVRRKIFNVVGQRPVPDFAQKFPIFKSGYFDDKLGRIGVWFLWDGENETRVDKLTEEQKDYPVLGILNDTALIDRIETDWVPRDMI